MRARAGLSARCGSRMGGSFAPGRLVVNARMRNDAGAAVGHSGGPGGPARFPVCNAAPATAELQPTVVVAARPPTEACCLLKGKVSVFICDEVPDVGLLAGALEC